MKRTTLLTLLLLCFGVSHAVEVEILDADKLEVRPITLPEGTQTELTIITGSPVRLKVDGDTIVAEYVEFDKSSRIMRLVGPGNVAYDNITTKGKDYILDLSNGDLNFRDVFIFTEPIDIEGVAATRQPGQIDISAAQFSPCSRCRSEVQDYRFSAERMNFYPGDRLVAFNVTVYLRDLPSFFLPLMVVPLGPQDRRPRFNLTRGSLSERASVALDWPYVFGANAFGTTSLRYYADVTPNSSTSPTETILGGTVTQNYFGGGFDHRFYTERGRGRARFFYTPSFLPRTDYDVKTPEAFEYTLGYKTEAALSGLQTDLLLERDDLTNPQIINLTARLGNTYKGFNFGYVTQTYFDLNLDPNDTSYSPSYDDAEGALRTYAQVQVSPEEDLSFSVGPLTLTNLLVTAGVYEDYANPSNNSATQASGLTIGGRSIIRGGRLLERHTVTLAPLTPFPGSSVSGSTNYTGQFYTTTNPGGENERLVDWTTTLSAEQTFDGGSFGVNFSRVILEGESPFAFDARTTPNSRTELTSTFSLTPLPWVDLSASETYVFRDDRSYGGFGTVGASELGAGPLETRAELFNNLDWLNVTLEQAYDLQNNDPGLLGATIELVSPNPVLTSRVQLSGVYDLDQRTRLTGAKVNESEVNLETQIGYTPYAALTVDLGYDFNGVSFDNFGGDYGNFNNGSTYSGSYSDGYTGNGSLEPGSEAVGVPLYKPLVFSLTAGTENQEDTVPSLTLSFDRDLNRDRMNSASYLATAKLGPLELTAEQNFDFDAYDASDTTFTVTYPGVAQLSASGFTPLPPQLIGLDLKPEDSTTYEVSLLDQTQEDNTKLYKVTYTTTYGPLYGVGDKQYQGFSDTSVTAQTNLETTFFETPLGALGFGIDANAILELSSDDQPLTYLSSAAAKFTVDFFSRVGLQGTLSYAALASGLDITSQTLSFNEFGPTVRILDDLYLSVIFDDQNGDVWNFTNPGQQRYDTPYNFQPLIYLTLDRCCWAFYGAINTKNGAISLTLGYPGSSQGLTGGFRIPTLALPERRYR